MRSAGGFVMLSKAKHLLRTARSVVAGSQFARRQLKRPLCPAQRNSLFMQSRQSPSCRATESCHADQSEASSPPRTIRRCLDRNPSHNNSKAGVMQSDRVCHAKRGRFCHAEQSEASSPPSTIRRCRIAVRPTTIRKPVSCRVTESVMQSASACQC